MSTQAVPGTVVPIGAQISPGGGFGPQGPTGPQGPGGQTSYDTTATSFTVPTVGSTATVNMNITGWATVGEFVYVANAGGTGQAAILQITGISGVQLTLLNPVQPSSMPLASSSTSGLMNQTSGLTTDFIDGTNHSQHFVPLVQTVPLDTLAAPTDVTTNNVTATQHGLMLKLPNTGKAYFRDDGGWSTPGIYYGGDSTNTAAYAMTVTADFRLLNGVVVWMWPSNGNSGASPTLNVNGTGAMPLVTRANYAIQAAGEIIANRLHGMMYNGSNWVIFTPVTRQYQQLNPGNPTVECAGYDAIAIFIQMNIAQGVGLTLSHVTPGVPIGIDLVNSYTAANAFWINVNNPAGSQNATYYQYSTGPNGGTISRIDSSTGSNLPASTHGVYNGTLYAGSNYAFFK